MDIVDQKNTGKAFPSLNEEALQIDIVGDTNFFRPHANYFIICFQWFVDDLHVEINAHDAKIQGFVILLQLAHKFSQVLNHNFTFLTLVCFFAALAFLTDAKYPMGNKKENVLLPPNAPFAVLIIFSPSQNLPPAHQNPRQDDHILIVAHCFVLQLRLGPLPL